MMSELVEPGGKVRLYVDATLSDGARIEANDAQAHYLLHVMRARASDRVSLFNGRDGEWQARIEQVTKRGCTLRCEKKIGLQRDASDIWLCFAPIKKTPADYVVQKATELGTSALQPIFTRRTIVTRVNSDRMTANAIEAAEQSGRLSVPVIMPATTLEKMLINWPADRKILFCDEAGDAMPVAKALRANSRCPWAVLTGPEGGFDAAERERIRSMPFVIPVSLGDRILRADTAALAALAIWQALLGS